MEKIRKIYDKYERYISIAAFFGGFIWDNLTLQRIDFWFDNLVILVYLFMSGAIILLLNFNSSFIQKRVHLLPVVLQFFLGGLFSVFVVFYSRSASIIVSWPFLIGLAGLLVGNEFFRKRYLRLAFQLSIFFTVLYSYSIFALPIVLGKIGADVFLLSGVLSLVLITLVGFVFAYVIPARWKESRRPLFLSVTVIYLSFHLFYFTNIIPPIPLSLKEGGIFHSVSRTSMGYAVKYESAPWYFFFKSYNPEFHWTPGTPVYAYSAVFSPAKINTQIFHRWSYFDAEKKEWIEKSLLGFPIVGGGDRGYRGYTFKNNIVPGKWRVDIITGRGQILGRMKFDVILADTPPELQTAIH